MSENAFIKKVQDTYFEELTLELDELKKMLKDVMPVQGYVDSEMTVDGGFVSFYFKDYYNEDKWDAADLLCKLTIDSEGLIILVEHDIPQVLNLVNKNIILFLSSLVGKRLKYKADNLSIEPHIKEIV